MHCPAMSALGLCSLLRCHYSFTRVLELLKTKTHNSQRGNLVDLGSKVVRHAYEVHQNSCKVGRVPKSRPNPSGHEIVISLLPRKSLKTSSLTAIIPAVVRVGIQPSSPPVIDSGDSTPIKPSMPRFHRLFDFAQTNAP